MEKFNTNNDSDIDDLLKQMNEGINNVKNTSYDSGDEITLESDSESEESSTSSSDNEETSSTSSSSIESDDVENSSLSSEFDDGKPIPLSRVTKKRGRQKEHENNNRAKKRRL